MPAALTSISTSPGPHAGSGEGRRSGAYRDARARATPGAAESTRRAISSRDARCRGRAAARSALRRGRRPRARLRCAEQLGPEQVDIRRRRRRRKIDAAAGEVRVLVEDHAQQADGRRLRDVVGVRVAAAACAPRVTRSRRSFAVGHRVSRAPARGAAARRCPSALSPASAACGRRGSRDRRCAAAARRRRRRRAASHPRGSPRAG